MNEWKIDGPNEVVIPEGATAHDVAVYPVIQLVKRDEAASGKCPECHKNRDQMGLVKKLLATPKFSQRFADSVTGAVSLPGEAFAEIPDELLITGAEVYYRPRDEYLLARGVKRATERDADELDEYQRAGWVGPIAEFSIPGGMKKAEAFLAAHNATLRTNHALFSRHEAHAAAGGNQPDGEPVAVEV